MSKGYSEACGSLQPIGLPVCHSGWTPGLGRVPVSKKWNRGRHCPLASRYMCMCIYMYTSTQTWETLTWGWPQTLPLMPHPHVFWDYRCMLPCLASAYSLIVLISSAWSAFLWICLPTKYVTSGVLSSVLFLLYIRPCWDSQPTLLHGERLRNLYLYPKMESSMWGTILDSSTWVVFECSKQSESMPSSHTVL